MPDDPDSVSDADIEDRIDQVGKYSRFAKTGVAVIGGAFVLALVGRLPYNLDSVPAAVNAVLLPTIFVGMGLLLFAIAMHLHLMHLNLVRQLRASNGDDGESSGRNSGP